MGHTVTNFVISQVYTGLSFFAFSLCYNSNGLYSAFGFNDPSRPVPTIIALLLFFSTVWEPIEKVISYGMTVHSRKCEFEAGKSALVLFHHMNSCVRYEVSVIWILHLAFISHYLTAFEPHVLTQVTISSLSSS